MTDLDKLIEAVDGGDMDFIQGDAWVNTWESLLPQTYHERIHDAPWHVVAWRCLDGSLDAAKALHEALLQGYRWSIQGDTGHASVWGADSDAAHTDPTNPARSWLIAILKAYRSLQ